MTTSCDLAAPNDIHAYLVDRFNLALRRPGAFGGESALRMLLDHLLFVERRPEVWAEEQEGFERRGAWSALGAQGAFVSLLPRDHGDSTASVYAEMAHRRGWLTADHVLDPAAYARVCGSVREWARRDRVWSDIVAEYGPPSVLCGGTNPLYGKTLGYLTESPSEPMVFFHLWNGTDPASGQSWPPDHPEPLLLAVRHGDGAFADTFTFTPEGRHRRPAPHPSPFSQ
ncbi:hypothetical protein AB0D04_04170 [Streptomyces sp. NPDC048483]|uniref:hypothetical protein n=1 Tax=Streptomyces sp. NPDC048483 TaxID=3154927 RepID=UPI003424F7B8